MSNREQLIGNWLGVEPSMSPKTGRYHFDWSQSDRPIQLSIVENGRSSGSKRFTQLGTMPENEVVKFKTMPSEMQLMIGFKEDGMRQIITYIYLLLDSDTLLLSVDGTPSASPYGQISFDGSYERLLIEEGICHHQFQEDAPLHSSPCKYTVHENDINYGTYWELQYEAKSVMGNIRKDRLWYFPAQQMFLKPPKYMLRRN